MRWLVVAVAVVGLGRPAFAVDEVAARKHYEAANQAYARGAYDEAVKEYMEAYRAAQDATLLYNVAQSYRLAGRQASALQYYRMYLQGVPDASDRSEIEKRISELEQKLGPGARTMPRPMPMPVAVPDAAMPPPPRDMAVPAPAPTPPPPQPKLPDAVPSDPAAAKVHYDKATALLMRKSYDEAAKEFRAAYLAAPDGAILYNIGQGYRFAGRAAEAVTYYRLYLGATPDAADRPAVEKLIEELSKPLKKPKKH